MPLVHIQNVQTAVTSAVEHLHELSTRMTSSNVLDTFKQDDVVKIDRLIAAIKELEQERTRIHEVYETETIRSSKLRYQLLYFPDSAEKEAEAAVASARASNAVKMKALSDQLANNKSEISALEAKHSALEAENTVLHPERETVRQHHEHIICQLNQRLADKAAMQITLNETRDKVRQTNDAILELEDGIILLKDQLIEERTQARIKKKDLKAQIADTMEKIKRQRAINARHREARADLKTEHTAWYAKVDTLEKSIKVMTDSYNKLDAAKNKLENRLDMLKQENEVIKETGEHLTFQDKKDDDDFVERKKKLNKRVKNLNDEIRVSNIKKGDLKLELTTVDTESKAAQFQRDKTSRKLDKKTVVLNSLKG